MCVWGALPCSPPAMATAPSIQCLGLEGRPGDTRLLAELAEPGAPQLIQADTSTAAHSMTQTLT